MTIGTGCDEEAAPDFGRWLDAAIARWDEEQPASGWGVNPKANRVAFAFRLFDSRGRPVEPLPLCHLDEARRKAYSIADDKGDRGRAYFGQPAGGSQRLNVVMSDGVRGYEAVMTMEDGVYALAPRVWRLSGDGRGVEVYTYQEDSRYMANAVTRRRPMRPWVPGERLSARMQAADAYQFVLFVRAFGPYFRGAVRVELAADYRGLTPRIVDEPEPGMYDGRHRSASADRIPVSVWLSLEALVGDGAAEAASRLIAPVIRLFDGWEVSGNFVRRALGGLRRRSPFQLC